MKRANRPVPTLIEEIAMTQDDRIEELEKAIALLRGACESVIEALHGPLPVDPAAVSALLQGALDAATV